MCVSLTSRVWVCTWLADVSIGGGDAFDPDKDVFASSLPRDALSDVDPGALRKEAERRKLAALRQKGRIGGEAKGPVVVTVMDRDRMADYQAMVGELRQAGIRAEVYLGNPKNFGNQLKYADKRGSPVAVIEGGEENANGVVQIKDLVLGARIAQSATLEEWKARPSQFEVPRAQLVAKVREILDGQGG